MKNFTFIIFTIAAFTTGCMDRHDSTSSFGDHVLRSSSCGTPHHAIMTISNYESAFQEGTSTSFVLQEIQSSCMIYGMATASTSGGNTTITGNNFTKDQHCSPSDTLSFPTTFTATVSGSTITIAGASCTLTFERRN